VGGTPGEEEVGGSETANVTDLEEWRPGVGLGPRSVGATRGEDEGEREQDSTHAVSTAAVRQAVPGPGSALGGLPLGEALVDQVDGPVEVLHAGDQCGDEPDDVAVGPAGDEDQVVVHGVCLGRLESLCFGGPCLPVLCELESYHQSEAPDVADGGMTLRQLVEPLERA